MMPRVFVVIRRARPSFNHTQINNISGHGTAANQSRYRLPRQHYYTHFLLRFLPAVVCLESNDLRLLFNCSKFVNNRTLPESAALAILEPTSTED
jgi:hypothetical protein